MYLSTGGVGVVTLTRSGLTPTQRSSPGTVPSGLLGTYAVLSAAYAHNSLYFLPRIFIITPGEPFWFLTPDEGGRNIDSDLVLNLTQ